MMFKLLLLLANAYSHPAQNDKHVLGLRTLAPGKCETDCLTVAKCCHGIVPDIGLGCNAVAGMCLANCILTGNSPIGNSPITKLSNLLQSNAPQDATL